MHSRHLKSPRYIPGSSDVILKVQVHLLPSLSLTEVLLWLQALFENFLSQTTFTASITLKTISPSNSVQKWELNGQASKKTFGQAYRAVSPEEFDRLWTILITRYPNTKAYLEADLYQCRERWAWAWVSIKFTAGVRTNGRAEVENRVNQYFSGAKTSFFQLFSSLNERTKAQD